MHAKNCRFLALECSNRSHSDLDKLMEALFFICSGCLAWQPPGAARRPRWAQDRRRQLRHPHLQEAWEARQRGGHHSSWQLAQWRRSGWCRRRRRSLVELISFADAPPAGLVRTKPRCTLQAHDVAIEVAQHFGKFIVKPVFGEVWSRRPVATVDAIS